MLRSLESLKEELNKTGVLSESYKTQIMAMAMAVAHEAYAAGKKDEKGD